MSEYSDAKLVLISNGRKTGKLFSLKPTNGSGDFTVVRDSPVWAIGQDGYLVETSPNVPCFEWLNGKPHLLPQLQSTNLIAYSNDFSDSSWIKSGVIPIEDNSILSPIENVNSYLICSLIETGVEHRVRKSLSLLPSTTYTVSVFLKHKDDGLYFYFRDLTNNVVSVIDIKNKLTTLNAVGQVIKFSETDINGFVKLDITFTTPSIIVNNLLDFGLTTYSYTFISPVPLNKGFYFCQVDLIEGSEATSPILTQGTPVTRLADDITVVPPVGVTEIIETINEVEKPPITVIPAIYQVPVGSINKIIMK